MLGIMEAAHQIAGCVPQPGFTPWWFADVSMLYLGRAGSWSWVQAVIPFPACVQAGWINIGASPSTGFGMSWDLPMGLRRCFSSCVVHLDLKRRHCLALNCFHLCAILKNVREAEMIPAVLKKQKLEKSKSSVNAGFLETKWEWGCPEDHTREKINTSGKQEFSRSC